MTFSDWYAATIAPQIEQSLKPLPKAVHEQIRKSSREAMAACWNAALEAASKPQLPASAEDYAAHIYSLRVSLN